MSEAKEGAAFVRHEFDEAIAVQRAIVASGEALAREHPNDAARAVIGRVAREDGRLLRDLERLGRRFQADGQAEEVAASLGELAATTAGSAPEAPSEAYEAHAVLIAMLRKQQDGAAAMRKIGSSLRDREVREASEAMRRQVKAEADELAKQLAAFAAEIASMGDGARPAR